jgi:chromosome segregation ATPase
MKRRNWKQKFFEAQEEIERLLCKNAELEVRCEGILKDYYAECQTCDEQKDEIERLKEKAISLLRASWKNKFFKAQEEIERLLCKNAELQKQVDELKSRNEKLLCDNCAYKDHIAKIDTLMKEVNERLDKVEEQAWICNSNGAEN